MFPEIIRLTNLNSGNVQAVIDTNEDLTDSMDTMLLGVAANADSFDFTGVTIPGEEPESAGTTVNFSRFTYSDEGTGSSVGDLFAFLEAWQYAQQLDAQLEGEGLEDVYAIAFRNDAGGFDVGVVDVVTDVVEEEPPVENGFFGFGQRH